jgi:hypothetical protein
MDILKYVRERNCGWTHKTTQAAARFGHLAILIYALENNCPVTSEAIVAAAKGGHLNCLMHLVSKNIQPTTRALLAAIRFANDDLEVVTFLLTHLSFTPKQRQEVIKFVNLQRRQGTV